MVFETPLLITISNVDLQTGLFILEKLSEVYSVKSILIKRVWETSQTSQDLMGGQIDDLKDHRFGRVEYA